MNIFITGQSWINIQLLGSSPTIMDKRYAFFGEGVTGWAIFDVSQVSQPRIGDLTGLWGARNNILLKDKKHVVIGDSDGGSSNGGISIINIEDLANPYVTGRVLFSNMKFRKVFVDPNEEYAYLAPTSHRLIRIFDIRNRTNPFWVNDYYTQDSQPTPYALGGRREDDGLMFYTHTDGMRVLNITNRTEPKLVSKLDSLTDFTFPPQIYARSNNTRFLYLGGGGSMKVIDLLDIKSPKVSEEYILGGAGMAYEVAIKGQYAYVTTSGNEGGIHVVKINDGIRISGTPDFKDCGRYVINISVSDGLDLSDNVMFTSFFLDVHGNDASCKLFHCNGYLSNDSTNVCSGHGECIDYEICHCNETYYGKNCEINTCHDQLSNETSICSYRGKCIDYNNCQCFNYSGSQCQYERCFGVGELETHVCGGHGSCVGPNRCNCDPGYSSTHFLGNCDIWFCGKYRYDDDANSDKICSGRGVCKERGICQCDDNEEEYFGDECEKWNCGIYDSEEANVCNGHGQCTKPNTCDCEYGYGSSECGTNVLLISLLVPFATVGSGLMILMFGMLICIIICCVCLVILLVFMACCAGLFSLTMTNVKQKINIKRYSELDNFDLLLQEQKLEQDESIAHLRFNKKLFEVQFDEIKTLSILGEGGSNSVVFKGYWSGQFIAFKCFKTRRLLAEQDKFEEFEKELEILSSVAHPHVIRFFGACLKPPRVGILMEFCDKGEIFDFVVEFRNDYGTEYPVFQKLRMATEICSALEYLHSRRIIHRDLKCENVLISGKDESTKLMDFGLSRVVEDMNVMKTSRIGTNIYMPPEILNGQYDEKCDVFSFAMLLYVLLTEIENGYGDGIEMFQIEFRVANDKNFRPDLSKIGVGGKEDEDMEWIKELIQKCWSHESEERLSCKQIRQILEKKGSLEAFEMKKKVKITKEEEESVGEGKKKLQRVEDLEKKIIELEIQLEEQKRRNDDLENRINLSTIDEE